MCGFQFYVDIPPMEADHIPLALEFSDDQVVAESSTYRLLREPDPTRLDTYISDSRAKRQLARSRLAGRGLELGALHQPLQVDPNRCAMSYADRLTKSQALETFPELRNEFAEQIVEPSYIVDLAKGDLANLADEKFDFFVANDVIEHLPNPVRFLHDVITLMKPGALLFLSVPDRDFTFDAPRDLTPLEHVWDEWERGVDSVDDDHIYDFMMHTFELHSFMGSTEPVPSDPVERKRLYEWHRERSIHVHVWDQATFDELTRGDRRPPSTGRHDHRPDHLRGTATAAWSTCSRRIDDEPAPRCRSGLAPADRLCPLST